MLPFLQPKKLASVIIARQKEDGSVVPEHEEGEQSPELKSHAANLIRAMHAKDEDGVAEAMQDIHNHLNPDEPDDAA